MSQLAPWHLVAVLLVVSSSACRNGHAPTRDVQRGPQGSKAGASDGTARPTPISSQATPEEICERYAEMYCDAPEDGASGSYRDLPPERQREVREECLVALATKEASARRVIVDCLDCVGECLSTRLCIQGHDLCKDREGLFE